MIAHEADLATPAHDTPFHRDGAFILRPSTPMTWDQFEEARHLYGCTVSWLALPDEAVAHAARFGLLLEESAR